MCTPTARETPAKSSGPRTIRGFSTSAATKMANERLHQLFKAYYGSDTHADDMITAAIKGTGFMENADDIARVEVAKKGSAYIAILIYAVHEMEDAIGDCLRGNLKDNDMGVHAWDEAVAFYRHPRRHVQRRELGRRARLPSRRKEVQELQRVRMHFDRRKEGSEFRHRLLGGRDRRIVQSKLRNL